MPDREKVIDCLQKAKMVIETWVPMFEQYNTPAGIDDAISLLKEQEPVKPDVDSEGTCTCGNCGENVGWYPVGSKEPVRLCKFCSECGQAVKWNG